VGEELARAGKLVAADRLRPEPEGCRVRLRDGRVQVTDGPFAETKEIVGGFYLIECASRAEAAEWAARLPIPEQGFIEVRPIWVL
jgi:hypothetical protein